MNIDYQAIVDGDPDTSQPLEDSFAAMKAETVVTNPEKLMTYLKIANEVSTLVSGALEKQVEAAITGNQIPKWVDKVLVSGGIDVNDQQTEQFLDDLVVDGGVLTQSMADAIKATGDVPVLKWPNLRIGHLQTARQLRLEGKI